MTSSGKGEADVQVLIERALEAQWNKFQSFLKREIDALPDLLIDKLANEHNKGTNGKFKLRMLESDHASMPTVRSPNKVVPRPNGDCMGAEKQTTNDVAQDTSDNALVSQQPIVPKPKPIKKPEEIPDHEHKLDPMLFVNNAKLQIYGFSGGVTGYLDSLRKEPDCFRAFVQGPIFASITSTAIFANAIYIGWESNEKMKNEFGRLTDHGSTTMSPIAEYCFIIFFVIEMIMRMAAQRVGWLLGKDRYWNLFDAFLILLSAIQLVADTGSNLSVFRVFRVFRLVRLLKVVRKLAFLESLKLMVLGIISCIMPLFWAITLLLIIMYAFGVFFMSCVVGWLEEQTAVSDEELMDGLDEKWGSMYKSMCVLFEGISGGNDWSELAKELKAIGEGYYLCFSLYIVFVTLGVLNIVTGFFVDGTMHASTSQKEEMLRAAQEKKNAMVEMIGELFVQLDSDGSGKITLHELESHLYDDDLQEYFCILEMEPEEAKDLFYLLDINSLGEVGINDFTNGCLKVMGAPKNLDICACMFQTKRMILMIENLTATVKKLGFNS